MFRSLCPGLVVLIAATPGFAQSWEPVKNIEPGRKLSVVAVNTPRAEGEFVSADDTSITLKDGPAPMSIPREDVIRVSSPGHRVRNAILLGLVGGFVGGYIGRPYYHNSLHDVIPIVMAAGFAAAGAALTRDRIYYEVKKDPRAKQVTGEIRRQHGAR